MPDAVRGAYAGLFGQAGRDPAARLEEMAAASAGELPGAAADRLGRDCERLEIEGRAERAVVAASAQADLLILARDGDRARPGPARPEEPGQDHPVRRRSRRVPGPAGLAGVRARRRHHSPAATPPFPAGPLNPRNPDTATCMTSRKHVTVTVLPRTGELDVPILHCHGRSVVSGAG